ncbi:MAG: OB-fold nucleic acid binding domain-containing protein [Candidatus Caldarchaeum sp.]|nr:OB-fold nucleic acid binding domain-containing protein [Candidatus Caldarchaeum sp.]MDW7977605.1 OB-fold nucleic acid binding domain-containing protein [Candidatus Caldarchaeum sp.]MDW8360312.1 OB-fold nucleic acid binding domain-containing protein [Candidatus Caldarchaeum sp.]
MSELVKIGSLTPRSRGVNLVAKIVEKPEPRVVSSQYDQSEHRLTEALIADETGAITLVLWDDNIDAVSEGDAVKVTNGFIKLFKGRMQLNLGRFGKIEPADVQIEEVNTENNLSQKESFSEERRERGGFRSRGFQRRRPFR